ncbi:hypothetical protein [Henriciella sp.]|uniref:hypothetical protein n=1 Tax=Henriciella sp. TaxID=1968823 RepID=UPI0017EF63D8|nr:hypothetical protein [Henriciella sp.]HIG23628.1 hypothetical protein [Henriciella sp.]
MRLILLALLPAALAACGNDGGYSSEDGTMPAPEPTMEEAAAEAQSNAGVSSDMPTPMEGSWATSTDRGDPAVSFSSDGETLLTLICRAEQVEGQGKTLVVQRATSEGGDSIDFLTSAGNVSIDAVALEMETPMIGGSVDPSTNGVATLVNANDAIRVRSGQDEIVVPAGEEMKTLVDDCRPERPEAEEEAEGEMDEEAETEE